MAKTVVHQDLTANWGDQDHLEVAQTRSFASMIFELLSERAPTKAQAKIFELILNISIDHGSETPSAVKTIEVAKAGASISEAVAAGLIEINDRHGGAIEPAMEFFYGLKDQDANQTAKDYLDNKKIIAGYGHRIYKEVDPRSELILKTLQAENLGQEWIDLAQAVQQAIADQKGTTLPLNIDGAIAVVLCTFGWEPKLAKAVFISARIPGLCGQFLNASE